MLLEAKLLLDEVTTEVLQDMGSLSGGYGRIWENMGGYGGIWERRRWFVRNE